MQTQRSYKTKDVDMLVTVSAIIENAIANQKFLQSKRTTWADPYFTDLKARIEAATQNFLGVDSAKELRKATQSVLSIQDRAIHSLAEAKVQIAEDFKSDKPRRDEILKQLGFASYHKTAQKGDQEALINLLYQFKTNLNADLATEITAAGTAQSVLDTIVGYADMLNRQNISQEVFKGAKKTITAAAINEFNEIYSLVISIAKIAAKFYKDKADKKDLFSYSKVSKALNITKAAKSPAAK